MTTVRSVVFDLHSGLTAKAVTATVGLAAACSLLFAGSAAGGVGVKPPPGTPDLSRMALATSDLGPSARVARQGYVKPTEGIVASYVREFRMGTARVNGKRLLFAESDIDLARTVGDAELFFEFIPLGFALLDPDEIAAGFREGGLRPTFVRVGKPARFRAGNQALSVTVRVGTKAGELRFVIAFVRVNRVVATIAVMGLPKVKLGPADVATLGRAVSRRIVEGLSPVSSVVPAVTGTTQVGQTLSATQGTWRNAPTRFAFQWSRCDAAGAGCTAVPGATGQTYVLTAADAGSAIRVAVTASNAFGSATALSPPTSPVLPAPGSPASVTPPTISGTATVGQTLTADPGTWTESPTSFSYSWRRCNAAGGACIDIAGASAQTYTVAAADAGSTIRVAVTASNASGAATALSAQTAVVP